MDVEALLRHILPCACRVVSAGSVPPERRFVVIPGLDGPRWIAPLDWQAAAPILQQWSPIDPVSRAKWRAVLMAYRLGCIERIPGTMVIGVSDLDLSAWQRLGLISSANLVPIIYVARPSTTRKAIVNLYAPERREIDCIVKVALGTHAAQSIAQDFQNLRSLEQSTLQLAPRPIAITADGRAASQQWIAGKVPLHPSQHLVETFLAALWRTETASLYDIAQQFRARFETLPRDTLSDPIARMFDSITCDDQVPLTFYHGDFVSWNMVCQTRDRCCAIDWEFGAMNGAPLMDLFHFFLRFALAAGKIDSYPMAARLTIGTHGRLSRSLLDQLGASHRYLDDVLALTLVAIHVTRFHQRCAVEHIKPQLQAIVTTFGGHHTGHSVRRQSLGSQSWRS